VDFQRKYAKYQSTVLFFGRLAIVPIILIMGGSLVIACLFSSNRDVPKILINYFVFVQFYGVFLAIAKALLLFVDGYYYQLSLLGFLDVLCIGRLYKERILAERLVVDVDYAYRIHRYLFGLIKVQKILSRDDAIKAKWIIIGGLGGDAAGEEYSIEMNGGTDNFVALNPLVQTAKIRRENDDVIDSDTTIISVNPIFQRVINNHKESSRLDQFSSSHLSDAHAPSIVEDDAALYIEYQNLQNQRDDMVYSMDTDNEIVISFEEWKVKRKEFKAGTRGSFVKYPLTYSLPSFLPYLLTYLLTYLLKKSIPSV